MPALFAHNSCIVISDTTPIAVKVCNKLIIDLNNKLNKMECEISELLMLLEIIYLVILQDIHDIDLQFIRIYLRCRWLRKINP